MYEDGTITANHSLDEKKAHEINYELSEEDYELREIEIIGYHLKRIVAIYISFLYIRRKLRLRKKPVKFYL